MVLLRERTWEGSAWRAGARWASSGWPALMVAVVSGLLGLVLGTIGQQAWAEHPAWGAIIGGSIGLVGGLAACWTCGAVIALHDQWEKAKAHIAWLETDDVAIRHLGELLADGIEMVNAASGHPIPQDVLGSATSWAYTVHVEIEAHFGLAVANQFMLSISPDTKARTGELDDVDMLYGELGGLPRFGQNEIEERVIVQAWSRKRVDWLRTFVNERRQAAGK